MEVKIRNKSNAIIVIETEAVPNSSLMGHSHIWVVGLSRVTTKIHYLLPIREFPQAVGI